MRFLTLSYLIVGLFLGVLLGVLLAHPSDALVNAAFTVIGAIISGVIGWIASRESSKEHSRIQHFNEIKNDCLKPIDNQLDYIEGAFDFKETDALEKFGFSGEKPDDNPHWWENFLVSKDSDLTLFDDLTNHYPKLVACLNEIESKVRSESMAIYDTRIEIIRSMMEKVRQLGPEDKSKLHVALNFSPIDTAGPSIEMPAKLAFLQLIDVPEEKWHNSYLGLEKDGGLRIIERIALDYSKDPLTEKLKKKLSDLAKSRETRRKIAMILRKTNLPGDCELLEP